MNNFYSQSEYYVKRWVSSLLKQSLEDFPVLVLTGARQVGKSTLLLNEEPFDKFRYLTLDDFDVLRQSQEHPDDLWAGTEHIVLDEVQKAPNLITAIKQNVDKTNGKIKFVLSGSANLLLMKQISESLAGRAIYHVLDPLTLGEINGTQPINLLNQILMGKWPKEEIVSPPPDIVPILQRGMMPTLLRFSSESSYSKWWGGYVATYLERDLRQISQIDSLVDFRHLMELLALRTGQLLNQSDLARDAGLSQPTTHRYLNLLETTHLFDRLPAFTSNRTTRLLKSPKAFWVDSGLASYLSGYYQVEGLREARELGNLFEAFIYHHIRVLAGLLSPAARIYHWRTVPGHEVDFVLEYGRKILAFEVKLTKKPSYHDANGLRKFLGDHPQSVGGIILHGGSDIRRLGENIMAFPWTMITG